MQFQPSDVDLKVGDTFLFTGPPPPTKWETFLWRWFRIETKERPHETRTCKVRHIYTAGESTQAS